LLGFEGILGGETDEWAEKRKMQGEGIIGRTGKAGRKLNNMSCAQVLY